MDPDPNLLTIPHEPMSLVDTPQQFPTTPSSSLGDSLCILSPLKIRESTFLKLGQATTKRFRLIEDEVDTVYVAQLSIHVPGSEEVIQPSLLRLAPTPNEPFSYSLALNLNINTQLFEAIVPYLSLHNTYSVQVDISIYELFAVTTAQFTGLLQPPAADPATGAERDLLEVPNAIAPSLTRRDSIASRFSGNSDSSGPYLGGEALQPASRFSSTSTLVSSHSGFSEVSLTESEAFTTTDHTRLRSWLKGHKRSASLVNRVSRRLERVREKLGSPRTPVQPDVPSRVMKLELDMERWEEDHKTQETDPVGSWASSVSLASDISGGDKDAK